MTARLQPSRGIYRQLAATRGKALSDDAAPLPSRRQAHGFVFQQFRNGEAVMRLDHINIVEVQPGSL